MDIFRGCDLSAAGGISESHQFMSQQPCLRSRGPPSPTLGPGAIFVLLAEWDEGGFAMDLSFCPRTGLVSFSPQVFDVRGGSWPVLGLQWLQLCAHGLKHTNSIFPTKGKSSAHSLKTQGPGCLDGGHTGSAVMGPVTCWVAWPQV